MSKNRYINAVTKRVFETQKNWFLKLVHTNLLLIFKRVNVHVQFFSLDIFLSIRSSRKRNHFSFKCAIFFIWRHFDTKCGVWSSFQNMEQKVWVFRFINLEEFLLFFLHFKCSQVFRFNLTLRSKHFFFGGGDFFLHFFLFLFISRLVQL